MNTLSIMIDETGNFNMDHYSSPYYCLTMVFHDQDDDITENIALFNDLLIRNGFSVSSKILNSSSPLTHRSCIFTAYFYSTESQITEQTVYLAHSAMACSFHL